MSLEKAGRGGIGKCSPILPPANLADNVRMKKKNRSFKDLTINVIGLGYGGTERLKKLSAAGFTHVRGFDTDPDAQDKAFLLSSELPGVVVSKKIQPADVWFMCVQTLLSDQDEPDLRWVLRASSIIGAELRRGDLVLICSTVGCGDTRNHIIPAINDAYYSEPDVVKKSDDYFVGYYPERSSPTLNEISPRIVAGCSLESLAKAKEFLDHLDEPEPHVVNTLEAAELAKLYENSYRALNVAFANEMADVCRSFGISAAEVFGAAGTKSFGFHSFDSGVGVGGYRVPVDPCFLMDSAESVGEPMPLLSRAVEMNNRRPRQIAARYASHFDRDKPITLFGITYKPDVSDIRNAPAIKILDELLDDGFDVQYHDPYVPNLFETGRDFESVEPTKENVAQVLLLVPHEVFEMVYPLILEHSIVFIDATS